MVDVLPLIRPLGMALLLVWPDPGSALANTRGAGLAQVCRVEGVELIVGGQQGTDQGCPADKPRRGSAVNTASPPGTGISAYVQQERDQERRRILLAELTREQKALAQLQQAGVHRDAAAWTRTQANIEALTRELTRMGPAR